VAVVILHIHKYEISN